MTLAGWLAGSGLVLTITSGVIGLAVEVWRPASPLRLRPRLLDLGFAAVEKTLSHAADPAVAALVGLALNYTGAGYFHLSNSGPGLVLSAAVYFMIYDFLRYWIHRLEHAVPILWTMHSLHHNAEHLNPFTGDRVYWLSAVLQAAILGLCLGVLFTVPPVIFVVFVCVQVMFRAITHANVRLHLGWLGLVVMGPQFHRIHHSIEPKHRNKNFAQTFPLFDLIFKTAWNPAPEEWPETGLDEAPEPVGLSDALFWPIRYFRWNRSPITGEKAVPHA
jgi:sterol desaturase/sphingolipid hydroxylase (fatty acid hydroxylase superfamily)